jgi:hypothetical protein
MILEDITQPPFSDFVQTLTMYKELIYVWWLWCNGV